MMVGTGNQQVTEPFLVVFKGSFYLEKMSCGVQTPENVIGHMNLFMNVLCIPLSC